MAYSQADAFVDVPDPDALAVECDSRNLEFFERLKDTPSAWLRLPLTTAADACRCRRLRCLDPRDDFVTAPAWLLYETDQVSCLAKQGSKFRTGEITRCRHPDVP